MLEREADSYWVSTYVEFRRRYEDPERHDREMLAPAREGVGELDGPAGADVMKVLEKVARRLERETRLATSSPSD